MVLAILQVADTGPLESLVVMLRAAGVDCALPSDGLKRELREAGCDTVLDTSTLVSKWGYDAPMQLETAGPVDMQRRDVLYVDIKAHRNAVRVWKRWPHLEGKTLWYRINGGKPEHVVNARGDMGDEVNPPCPVLTPNQWYEVCPACDGDGSASAALAVGAGGSRGADGVFRDRNGLEMPMKTVGGPCRQCQGAQVSPTAYCCWPPFHRFNDYALPRLPDNYRSDPPLCLIHGVMGWGYDVLVDKFRSELGVRCYGVASPDGLLKHREVPTRLSKTLCMVHLKSSDAPGYAIYECLAAACPLVCTRRLIDRCRMGNLLIPGETCLVFDRTGDQGLTPEDVVACAREVGEHVKALGNPEYNRRIGEAGRRRLLELMWSKDRSADVASLKEFLRRNFGV